MDPQYLYYSNLYFTEYSDDGYWTNLQKKNNMDYYPQSIIRYKNNN